LLHLILVTRKDDDCLKENSSKYSKIPLLFISFLYKHLQIARDLAMGWTILKGRKIFLFSQTSELVLVPIPTSSSRGTGGGNTFTKGKMAGE